MWLDKERTISEIARFSKDDAQAYRRLLADYDEVKSAFSGSQFTPVGFGPSLDQRLAEPSARPGLAAPSASCRRGTSSGTSSPTGTSRRSCSGWRSRPTRPSTCPVPGVLAYSLIFGRQQRSWSILPGGSGTLIDALTRYLEDHGSTIVTGKAVTRLILDGDRCAGVADRRRGTVPGRARQCCRPSTSPTSGTWPPRRCGPRSSTTASTPTTPVSPASACTWPRAHRRCSRPRTRPPARRSRPAPSAGPRT